MPHRVTTVLGASRGKRVTWVRLAETAAGRIAVAASENGLVLSDIPGGAPEEGRSENGEEARPAFGGADRSPPPRRRPPTGVAGYLDDAERALRAYYAHWPAYPGRGIQALWDELTRLPVDLEGLTAFSRTVLLLLRKIPPGMVISYGALAAQAGSPRAARAVGAILARNPLPIILPCHRVIAADGSLGGFSGGRRQDALRLKRRLLGYEGWDLGVAGGGSPDER